MVKLDKIYTRGGDKGKTSLGNGERVDKNSIRVEAFGTVDESNSVLGIAIINLKSPFIQNAVSINDGGGGMYCDGHDAPYGRYQSFCTNDYTQVNSDGF